jgi:hypothetical protein
VKLQSVQRELDLRQETSDEGDEGNMTFMLNGGAVVGTETKHSVSDEVS